MSVNKHSCKNAPHIEHRKAARGGPIHGCNVEVEIHSRERHHRMWLPMFLFFALSCRAEDPAHVFHTSVFRYLLGHWTDGFCISAFLGFVIALLAWRRIHSEMWPGTEPDPESSTTTLGTLSRK